MIVYLSLGRTQLQGKRGRTLKDTLWGSGVTFRVIWLVL